MSVDIPAAASTLSDLVDGGPDLSGERLYATYRILGDQASVRERASAICVEQTVEFPFDLLPPGAIRDQIVGRIDAIDEVDRHAYRVRIGFAVETSGFEPTQLLNLLFGNTSLKPGVRLESIEPSPRLLGALPGPRFGCAGVRARLGVFDRPLLATALKPMGLAPAALATLAYRCALGGIDIVKDDHGLTDQPFSPFEERVARCAEAVERANRETGHRAIYVANLTGPLAGLAARARYAYSVGAGGLMMTPGLMGLDAIRMIAADDAVDLPILSHPAFQGGFVTDQASGLSHYFLFGQLPRLVGADASIYPNWGGRFAFTREDCTKIVAGCGDPFGGIGPIFPVPGGGLTLERLASLIDLYGDELIYLIGGDLHRAGPDLVANCLEFRRMVDKRAPRTLARGQSSNL